MKTVLLTLPAAVFALLLASPASAAPLTPPIPVTIHESNPGAVSFDVASANQAGGLDIAAADLGGDGVAELIAAHGIGNEPRVHILRQDGSKIASFLAYAPDMGLGVNIAVCDLNGDGEMEIATAPGRGAGPHVKVFDAYGEELDAGWFAYAEHARMGVHLACGNLDEDDADELVTLPAAGGGPHVRIWNWDDDESGLADEFFASGASDGRGLVGTVHDGTLHIANHRGEDIHTRTWNPRTRELTEHARANADATGTTSLFVFNGRLHAALASTSRIIDIDTGERTAVETDFGSVEATAADLDDDGSDELITTFGRSAFADTDAAPEKSIVVDISEQRIYAYEQGVLANSFLVSTGRYPFATPKGEHSVLAKRPYVHYRWTYGPNDPRNYDLGVQPWNLRIYPHIYIHYAPWHNNFGIPQSHGCINVNLENIKWIYNWAEEGIPVTVRD